MRRIISILLSLSLMVISTDGHSAGWGKIGVKGAFCTAVNGDVGDAKFRGGGGGVAVSVNLPVQGMTLQPEVNLLGKYGHTVVEVPLNLQVGLDLMMVRPFACVTPYFFCPVGGCAGEEVNRFQAGIGVGGGIDIWKFQIQCRYNWNVTDFYTLKDESGSDVRNRVRGVDISLVFFF